MFIKHNYSHPLLRFLEKSRIPDDTRPMRAGSARMRRYLSAWSEACDVVPESVSTEIELCAVDSERAFRAADGSEFYTLLDMYTALQRMEEEHYNHHALGESNDFACWLRDVWEEEIAADLIARASAREEATAVVERLLRRRGEL
ncbi:MAG: hypothetical protein WDZ79_00510 [Candidatus Paceibacterota bacterium]